MNYKLKARKGGCLVTFVVIVLIIVAIVVGGVTYVLNKTPDEIGLGGVSLGNDTVDGVGLGNVKISELLNLAKSLTKNAYTLDGNNLPTNEDKAASDKTAEVWNLGKKGDDVYYGKLFVQLEPVCDNALLTLAKSNYTLPETQLAYMFNVALNQFYADSKVITDLAQTAGNESLSQIVASLKILQTLDASVCRMHFVADGDDVVLKLAVSVDISDYTGKVSIPFVTLADIVYADIDIKVNLSDEGRLQGTFSSVSVNGNNRDVSLKVLDAVFKLIATENDEPLTTAQISGYATEVVSYLFSRIGRIQNIDTASGTVKLVSASEYVYSK